MRHSRQSAKRTSPSLGTFDRDGNARAAYVRMGAAQTLASTLASDPSWLDRVLPVRRAGSPGSVAEPEDVALEVVREWYLPRNVGEQRRQIIAKLLLRAAQSPPGRHHREWTRMVGAHAYWESTATPRAWVRRDSLYSAAEGALMLAHRGAARCPLCESALPGLRQTFSGPVRDRCVRRLYCDGCNEDQAERTREVEYVRAALDLAGPAILGGPLRKGRGDRMQTR